jgi:hypothetical protein
MWAELDWPILLLALFVCGFLLWLYSQNADQAKDVSNRLQRNVRLYERIQAGMREYDLRYPKARFPEAEDVQLILEDARMSVFQVNHLIQTRVGFHFKDINEYGLYGFIAADDDEFQESYYRSDRAFQQEELLLYDDE